MDNRYLQNNYAPIKQEHTLMDLPVSGAIPKHLDGRYLRNGSNPLSADPNTYNWFTGDGMVHGVRIRDGKAEWYRNRWVRSPRVSAGLGEHRRSRRRAFLDDFGANTNVIGHAGRTLALMEAGVPTCELNDELDTLGTCDFDGALPTGCAPHPKRDPQTGELHAVSYFFGWGNRVQYSVIGCDGRIRRKLDVEVTGSPMMHDFSLTEKHVVFYDLPVKFDASQAAAMSVPRLLRGPAQLAFSALVGRVRMPDSLSRALTKYSRANDRNPYRWDPTAPARIGVMPREGGAREVRWFEVQPCYVYHPLNAYDEGQSIVLEVVRHAKTFDVDLRGPNETSPTLERWTVDLNAGSVREERLDDRAQEFPRVDERLVSRRHRYGYTMAWDAKRNTPSDTVLKHDMLRGGTTGRAFGKGREVGEFVFEPNSRAAAEDEGVLMGFVYDADRDGSDLMLLDAGSLEIQASVHLPVRVPTGFHGNWVASGG